MLGDCLDHVRAKAPLIHCITNYVTVNDVANMLLACGGSPVMSDDVEEVEEVTALAAGLCLNIGTLNRRTVPSMFAAGRRANTLGHPVVLDPVGAGSSALRTRTARELAQILRPGGDGGQSGGGSFLCEIGGCPPGRRCRRHRGHRPGI